MVTQSNGAGNGLHTSGFHNIQLLPFLMTGEQNYSNEVIPQEESLPDDDHTLEMEDGDLVDSEEVSSALASMSRIPLDIFFSLCVCVIMMISYLFIKVNSDLNCG